MMKIMNKKNIVKKTNIITLNRYRPFKDKPPTTLEVEQKQNALLAWDEKGVPCISWSCRHNKSPISEMLLPTFTQSCFQSILNKKLSTTEDLKNE
jgi:hypothetical protein